MYKGTHVKKGGGARVYMSRTTALLIAIVMIVGAAIGSTVAYLIARSDSMVNNFTYATVSCAVTENVVNGNSKNGVQVQNTGTTDAYIRADVVVNWIDADGKILPRLPRMQLHYPPESRRQVDAGRGPVLLLLDARRTRRKDRGQPCKLHGQRPGGFGL